MFRVSTVHAASRMASKVLTAYQPYIEFGFGSSPLSVIFFLPRFLYFILSVHAYPQASLDRSKFQMIRYLNLISSSKFIIFHIRNIQRNGIIHFRLQSISTIRITKPSVHVVRMFLQIFLPQFMTWMIAGNGEDGSCI